MHALYKMRRSQNILSLAINIPITTLPIMTRPSLRASSLHISDFLVKWIFVHVIMALRWVHRADRSSELRERRSVQAVLASWRQRRSVVASVAHRSTFTSMFITAEHAVQNAGETSEHDEEEEAKNASGDDGFITDAVLQRVGDLDDSASNVIGSYISRTGKERVG